MGSIGIFALSEAPAAGHILANAVGSSDLSGVLQEVVNLLPVLIPVSIGFIGLRKGVSFLFSLLRSA